MKNNMRFFSLIIGLMLLNLTITVNASVSEGGKSKATNYPLSAFKKVNSGGTTAKVFGVDKTVSVKFTNPTDNTKTISTSGGTFKGEVDGVNGKFYCIDLFHYVQWYTESQPHTYTDNGKANSQIIYILNNYYPFKAYPYTGAASSEQIEAAAVQVALWHYVDNVDVSTVDNTNVKVRAQQIITDTDANYSSFYPFETLQIVPSDQTIPIGGTASFFVSAFDANGNPVSNVTVNLTSNNGVLSTTSLTTGSNGNTPSFTFTSGSLSSVVTATASVAVTQGIRYVHSVEPDKWQKLVLATPSGITRTASANVTWYAPSPCDTKGYTTFTQGGWGNKNGVPARIRDQYFSSVFPSGLVVGGTYKLTLSNSEKVKEFLPQGGTASAYTQNYNNVESTSAGVLGGQLVALKCNVAYSSAGYLGSNTTKLGELKIASGPFSGKTVNQFLALLETAVGGGSLGGFTFSQFNDAATAINENFDNGTVDKGFLTCSQANVKASIGDKVWFDTDKDGVQDSGENGVQNVTVKLYDCSNNLIGTKTTDANGLYLFADLNPGSYYVKFELPSGYLFTTKDATDDDKDSDADISTGKTICTDLVAGEDDLTWDAGIYQEACKNKIGDYVWHDTDVDGIQDATEKGIKDVTVELLQSNAVIATTKTDADGKYEFTNLANGTYAVKVAASNYASGGVLFNTSNTKWYSTKKNQGSDDSKDSDAAKNESVSVTLNCGDNVTLDFGFYKTCVTITKTADKQSAKPGDKITYTFTVENCGDIQHHGGIDIFDKMINSKSPYLIKHIDLLDPTKSTTFTATYTVKNSDCGDLINEVTAEAHPTDGSAYVTDKSTFTVKVDCGPTCTTDWSVDLGNDVGLCDHEPKVINVSGTATVTPSPSSGFLVTSWQITYPNDGSVDNSKKTTTVAITGSTPFQMNINWPGVRPVDQLVEVEVSVLVLDCNKNPLGKEVVKKWYWNPTVCPPPPSNEADIKIEKSSSTQTPKCGEAFTYTIKVTNQGPAEAKAVQVTDQLPSGATYVSSNAAQGTYNETTGLWSVGNLANGASTTLTISVKVDCDVINNSVFDLGIAKEYNLFVIQDLTQPSSDTEGRVAVGRDASLANYSVGDKLSPNSGDVLIVGRNLTYTSGRVYNGDVAYGNSTNLPIYQTSIDGSLRNDSPINFANAKTYLENLSATLGGYTVTGTTSYQFSGLTLTGTDPYLNVFYVKGSDLSTANSFTVDVPNGSAVLVNIDGTNVSWSGGLEVYGTAINNVLYNFYQATTITIKNIDVRGSILAPFAAVNFESGVQNGQMICKSLTGRGQFNNSLFFGNIPADKKVTNIASISGSLTTDPVSNNNSSLVTVNVNAVNQSPGGGNPGGGTTGGTWQQVGSFAAGEIVYSLAFDANGNTYAGTMGGKIYKSVDGGMNWTRINSTMNVGWIWSLAFHNNILFASTEKGIFKFSNSVWSEAGLKDVDVRSIASSGTVLYAGTWGSGVYSSADNGANWIEIKTGMENFLAVQAVTVSKAGDVFAGTVGGGVFKLFKGEDKWYQYDLGNNIVWALASNTTVVIASTYGDGLYRSVDNGANWEKTSLTQPYIYSINVDKSGRIYVTSWTSGVSTSIDNGVTWTPLGMGGFGVSSLVVSPNQSDVLAGTREGKIYKISFNVTDVDGDGTVPSEFKLSQNYPNPFNPTTTIEVALPKAGRYSLKVYNILGQEVAVLLNKEMSAGLHKVTFDASRYASGMYIYRLTGSNVNIAKKMLLMK
ncbi:MAG: SdrD B-like domain-containing protein [Melioribacteraceae bacterium]